MKMEKSITGWWIVLTAAVVTGFVYSGIVSATGAFMLPVTQDLGLSVAAIFTLYLTIMSLTSILTLVIVSKHMDRKNIKKLMITAGIIGIISFAGFALAHVIDLVVIGKICAFAVPGGVRRHRVCGCAGRFRLSPFEQGQGDAYGQQSRQCADHTDQVLQWGVSPR